MRELDPFTIPDSLLFALILAPFAIRLTLKSTESLALYQSNGVASPVLSAINLCPVLVWWAAFAGATSRACSRLKTTSSYLSRYFGFLKDSFYFIDYIIFSFQIQT